LKAINEILNTFEPVSLKEIDSVKLMDRTDTKFVFNRSKIPEVLSLITEFYKVLQIDGKKISRYKTLYYDTPSFSLYLAHHNGHLNRIKIRHRTYIDSSLGFLEIKLKTNKERTIKTRIKQKETPLSWQTSSIEFIEKSTPFSPEALVPSLWVNYSRLTFVNKQSAERITIDLGLEFLKNEGVQGFNELVIAEVKQEKKKPSPFLKIMKQLHIREGFISKYCLGVTVMYPNLKKNNFKSKLLHLNHILYDSHISFASSR